MSHSSHVWSIVNNVWQCSSLYSSRLAIDTLLLFWSTHKRQLPRFSEVQVLVLQSGRAGRGRLPPFWTGKNQHICLESDFFGWSLKLGTHGNRWEPMGTHGKPWKPQDADLKRHRILSWQLQATPTLARSLLDSVGAGGPEKEAAATTHQRGPNKKWPDQKRWKKPVGKITWKHLVDPTFRTITCTVWLKSAEAKEDLKKLASHSVTVSEARERYERQPWNTKHSAKCWGHPPSTSSLASSVHKLGPSQGQQMAKVAPLNLWIWYIIPYYTIIPYNNV